MRIARALLGGLQFIFGTFFLLVGGVVLFASYSETLLNALSLYFATGGEGLRFLGTLLLISAGLWMLSLRFIYRGSTTILKVNPHDYSLDASLVKQMLLKRWSKKWPGVKEPRSIEVVGRDIELTLDDKWEEKKLRDLEKDLGRFFAKHFGYRRSFYIHLVGKR